MFIVENNRIGLLQYTHKDDEDMLACWNDIETQKGYNYRFDGSLETLNSIAVSDFRFWVTIVDKSSDTKVGVLRLGMDEQCPDLAIWIYPGFRNKGFGKESFALAAEYILEHLDFAEISAGCYMDNTYSLKMLERVGFGRHPEGDQAEINSFTGEPTVQLEFRKKR